MHSQYCSHASEDAQILRKKSEKKKLEHRKC